MRLIQLLEQKNHYLEKFLTLNELQLKLISQTEIDTLDEFYEKREKILEIIQYIDSQITNAYQSHSEHEINQEETAIQKLLFIKDEYVYRILDQDIQILACIDQARQSILSELSDIQNAKKAIKGYHSKSTGNKNLNRTKIY